LDCDAFAKPAMSGVGANLPTIATEMPKQRQRAGGVLTVLSLWNRMNAGRRREANKWPITRLRVQQSLRRV
jgi:hypothetical protein